MIKTDRLRPALLACGLLSSVLYVSADIFAAARYPGYDYTSQAISEMSAIGAPTANLLAPLYTLYSILFACDRGARYRLGNLPDERSGS